MTETAAYRVYVDDNFQYMDEECRYQQGSYDDWESAVAVCRQIVDDFLQLNYKPGMKSTELWEQYRDFGEDPFIVGPDSEPPAFSAWSYARHRCTEICGER